jgi:serine/threonine-protein kinase
MPFFCIDCKTALSPDAPACTKCGEPVTDFVRKYLENPVDGKYRIVSRLGRGGMGEVYKAVHIHLDAVRVLKLMRPNLVDEKGANERFIREAKLATRIHHSSVATLHDFSLLPDGSYYMVWEYIDGTNLTAYLRQKGPLSPRHTARLAIQALHGLEAIHRAGIVHRDVSPDNLMIINSSSGEEEVKIIDLGIAKTGDERATDQTRAGVFIGKLKYCSPEHLGMLEEGEKIDGRADLYSMGLVMYEMLTGRPAFVGTSPHHYVIAHSTQNPKPLREVNPVVQSSPALEAALFRALEKDRQKRFSSARDFAGALERMLPELADDIEPSAAPTLVQELPPAMLPRTAATQSEPTLVDRTPVPAFAPPQPQRQPSSALAFFGLGLVAVALLGIGGAGYAVWRYSRETPPVKVDLKALPPPAAPTPAPAPDEVVPQPLNETALSTQLSVVEEASPTPGPPPPPIEQSTPVARTTPRATQRTTSSPTPIPARVIEPDSLTTVIMPANTFQRSIIRDDSRLTKESNVNRAWIKEGLKLSQYRIRIRAFRNATDHESPEMMQSLSDVLQEELDGVSEEDSDVLTADGLVVWAENRKGQRRGVEIEMVFRDSAGKVVAELRHRIIENSPEDAAQEMVEAITDFVEDHRIR